MRSRIGRRALLLGAASAAALPAAARASNERTRFVLDLAEAPHLDGWSKELVRRAAAWWPRIARALASPGFVAADEVTIRFSNDTDDAYATALGTLVTVNADYITRNPDDFGCVAHELAHVVQDYPDTAGPVWLVEGVADFIRYYTLFPDDPRRAFVAGEVDYRSAYQPTAAFLDYLEATRAPGCVRYVNGVMRAGGDGEAALRQVAAAPLDALWRKFKATLR